MTFWNAALGERLDKAKGSPQRHAEAINVFHVENAKHAAGGATVAAIQSDVATLKASAVTTDARIAETEEWTKDIGAAIGGSAVLLFQKLPEILKLVDGK